MLCIPGNMFNIGCVPVRADKGMDRLVPGIFTVVCCSVRGERGGNNRLVCLEAIGTCGDDSWSVTVFAGIVYV